MGSVGSRVQFPVQNPSRNEQENEQNSDGVQKKFKHEKKLNKSELAYNFVNNFVNTYREIPKTTEDISQYDFSNTYLSYAIHDYIYDNAEALLQDGLVNQERIAQDRANVESRA